MIRRVWSYQQDHQKPTNSKNRQIQCPKEQITQGQLIIYKALYRHIGLSNTKTIKRTRMTSDIVCQRLGTYVMVIFWFRSFTPNYVLLYKWHSTSIHNNLAPYITVMHLITCIFHVLADRLIAYIYTDKMKDKTTFGRPIFLLNI